MGDELGVRKFVHGMLLGKDVSYERIESIHMNEITGVIAVRWIDREKRVRDDTFQYRRKV